jgi:hypothetical protein
MAPVRTGDEELMVEEVERLGVRRLADIVVQHRRSGPCRSSIVSRIELRRTSSASQTNSRCDL